MSFTDSDIIKVAHLARLYIEDSELPEYAANMSKILNLVEQINQANTDHTKPMAHPITDMIQRMREDVPTETNERDLFQENAPATEAGLYLVPKVIDDK